MAGINVCVRPKCANLTHVATSELTREDKSSGEAAWFHVFVKSSWQHRECEPRGARICVLPLMQQQTAKRPNSQNAQQFCLLPNIHAASWADILGMI